MRVYIVFYKYLNGPETGGYAVKLIHKVCETRLSEITECLRLNGDLFQNYRIQYEFVCHPDNHYLERFKNGQV